MGSAFDVRILSLATVDEVPGLAISRNSMPQLKSRLGAHIAVFGKHDLNVVINDFGEAAILLILAKNGGSAYSTAEFNPSYFLILEILN